MLLWNLKSCVSSFNKFDDDMMATVQMYFPTPASICTHLNPEKIPWLPTMHCFQWNIFYRWLCGSLVTKHT